MTFSITRFARLAAATGLSAALAIGPALADGPSRRGSIKDPVEAPAPRACALSANVALATEYVFRGISQTAEGPSIQGGFDATCGMFYAGVWASNLDWGVSGTDIEIDWYAGIKRKTDRITWDFGVIYYSYPSSTEAFAGRDNNYVELKLGASAEIWKDGTLSGTVFWSPDYQFETGNVFTFEAGFAQVLPKFGMFTTTFSALIGYQVGDDNAYRTFITNGGDDNYLYWNAGVTFGFLEKWSIDLRYWDSNLSSQAGNGSAFCNGATLQCDERFMATLKFTY